MIPFVHMFYSSPSSYLWEDDSGVVRTIQQGEGGEEGDALMPLLFCVGQHADLEKLQAMSRPNERLLAYLDDVYVVSKPDWVGAVYTALQESLWVHVRIRVHGGKTHVWNQAGQKPDVCEAMQRIAEVSNPRAQVWRGAEVPSTMQGIKVLGTPLGHPDYVATHLEEMRRKHDVLLQAIPTVPDVQSAWLFLLHFVSARDNCLLRVVRPEWVDQFALSHDESVWSCLCTILRIPANMGHEHTKITSTLPVSLGGLGLRSALRTCVAAYWASWADALAKIQDRHPTVAVRIVYHLEGVLESPCLSSRLAEPLPVWTASVDVRCLSGQLWSEG